MSRYDLVVYGASGFTGQFVVEYVHRASIEHGLSWAVAGRSEGKLQAVLDRAGKTVAADLSSTPVIVSTMYPFPSQIPCLNLFLEEQMCWGNLTSPSAILNPITILFRLPTPLTPHHCWGWLHSPRWCLTVWDHTGESNLMP